MSEATFFLFKALMDIITIGIVFNFLFRLLRVDYYNPLVQGIIKAVDFPSQILRSLIKPIYSLDLSSFLVALFVQAGAFYLAAMAGSLDYEPLKILLWSAYSVILLILKMVWWIMLGGIILSWVAGDIHPAIVLIRQMADKLLNPLESYCLLWAVSTSPIFAFILLNFFKLYLFNSQLSSLPVWLSVGF